MCLLICCCTLKDIIFLFVPSDSCSLKTFCSSILLSDKRLNKIVHWVCMVSHLAVIAHSRLLPKDMHALLTFYLKQASTKRSTELKANDNISIRYSTLALKFSLFKHISIVFSRNSHQKPHTKIQDQWPFVTKATAAISIILKWLSYLLTFQNVLPLCLTLRNIHKIIQ